MATPKGKKDCSGVISAVAFGVFCILGSLLLFYLISGPPTFLEVETLAPGDTLFHETTWSRLWCNCLKFENVNNHSADDIALYRLAESAKLSLNRTLSYDAAQVVDDPYQVFEFFEAYFHPGASGEANYSFSRPVTFYLAPSYYVNGLNRGADYQDHAVMKHTNVTEGVLRTPKFNASGGWAFVWEKDFKDQAATQGNISYHFDMREYELPHPPADDVIHGAGQFCWEADETPSRWFLAAKETAELQTPRLRAHMWCVPRYKLSIPITAIPVAIALVLEVLIIIFCIVRPWRAQKYERL